MAKGIKFSKKIIMSFKVVTSGIIVFVGVLVYLILPKAIETIKNNPEANFMRLHPNFTYNYFKNCTIHVVDVNRCYNAYSVAIDIANSKDCTSSNIERKRKFKHLVEHSTDETIEDEIKKECS